MHHISKTRPLLPVIFRMWLFFTVFTVFFGGVSHGQDSVPAEGASTDNVSLETESVEGGAIDGNRNEIREEDILISPQDVAPLEGDVAGSRSPVGSLFKLALILILLCVACYFVLKYLKKSSTDTAADAFLKNVASLPLASGKSVSVVTLGEQAFLIGVADHSVSLIAEITDAELIDRMNLNADISAEKRKSFMDILSGLIPKYRQQGGSPSGTPFQSSTDEAAAFLRSSRERLKTRSSGFSLRDGGASAGGENPENSNNGGRE